MKLFAKIINENEYRTTWSTHKPVTLSEDKSGYWYEVEREPDPENREYLEYNPSKDIIEIKQREKTQDEIDSEQKQAIQEKIREKYSRDDELKIVRETLAKIIHNLQLDISEFKTYNSEIEAIIK